MTATSGRSTGARFPYGVAKAPPVVARCRNQARKYHRGIRRAESTRSKLEFRGPEASRTSLRHAAFGARADVHLFPCELFDVKLKRRQPAKLDGQQRVGDA